MREPPDALSKFLPPSELEPVYFARLPERNLYIFGLSPISEWEEQDDDSQDFDFEGDESSSSSESEESEIDTADLEMAFQQTPENVGKKYNLRPKRPLPVINGKVLRQHPLHEDSPAFVLFVALTSTGKLVNLHKAIFEEAKRTNAKLLPMKKSSLGPVIETSPQVAEAQQKFFEIEKLRLNRS